MRFAIGKGENAMRFMTLSFVAIGAVACQTAAEPPARTAKAQATYDRMLAGKVAGKPAMCLPTRRSNDMVVIDDNTILFRDGRTVWVNQPPGGCMNLGNGSYALQTRSVGSQMCRGDIARVTDMTAGIDVGSCALGAFVPYRAPGR